MSDKTNTYFYQACYEYEGYIEAKDIYDAIKLTTEELREKVKESEQIGSDISLRVWRVSDMANMNNNE